MKFAFFPGCMIQVRYPQMEAAVRQTVPAFDIELVDLPGLGCCPDPVFYKALHKLDWLVLAARNLVIAEQAGLDYVTICSDTSNKGLHGVTGEVVLDEYRGDNPLYAKGGVHAANFSIR